ncbi:hypothetical protein QJS04_geneDACA011795 [Acorus gramineus]|uniref:Uncharacterized protein n=1 Tax=Acorus gramineus TaxID=55184 RepID=A0AAV9BG86_ACOGR|nr:hypothetical protein QJS04_geneDACA011795 [Acorus gramineus]
MRDRDIQQVQLWEATMRGKLVSGGAMTEADLDLLPLEVECSFSTSVTTGATFSRASRPSTTQNCGRYMRVPSSVRETPAAPDAPEVQSSPQPPPPSQPSQDIPPSTQPPMDDDNTLRYSFVLVLVEELYLCKDFILSSFLLAQVIISMIQSSRHSDESFLSGLLSFFC